jgi:S-adenosylmethionine synthetase
VWLESLLTSSEFRARYDTGTDVKVMVVRADDGLDVTAAVPFHPSRVTGWADYREQLDGIRDDLGTQMKAFLEELPVEINGARVHLNTKDVPGRGYLTPFGTSLGKGDCGAVGRGNRYNGVIEPLRPASGEAPAGKNRQIQSVEASASTSSANISEGFFQSKILRGRSLISAATIAR